MDDAQLDLLLHKCRSSDVDVKVDALAKLQGLFEAGVEISDGDALLSVLKTCLRTPNQHLMAASLAALLPMLPLLIANERWAAYPNTVSPSVDVTLLRHAISAFLPAGGIIDRLGDNREKTRDKAKECLVTLGGLCFQAGAGATANRSKDGKTAETALQLFERSLREAGLGSRVWRVREQSILALVLIRRIHNFFPMRPYLPNLVDCLEDTDGTVRECARQSIVELFTGQGVTDAARADLKKEMAKKGVRRAIVDSVQSRLLNGGFGPAASGLGSQPQSEVGSENGDTGKVREYIPPSLALRRPANQTGTGPERSRTTSHSSVTSIPRPGSRAAGDVALSTPAGESAEIQAVYIASTRDLEIEFSKMLPAFDGKETEHNWSPRERSVVRIRGMLKGGAYNKYTDAFLAGLRGGMIDATLKTLASLRTTVAAHTCSLYCELAIILGPNLDAFCDPLLTHLLRMASFTKKIAAEQSQAAVGMILKHTSAQPRVILPLLWSIMQEKSIQARLYTVTHCQTYLEVHGSRSKHALETTGGVDTLDKCIRRALTDPNVGVREKARPCFWVYEGIWREKAIAIMGSLDTSARKQLEKACPHPSTISLVTSETPAAKKTSVAAAIAASRAKAKAIAASPPTLRHQATSTFHSLRTTSPPNRLTALPGKPADSSHSDSSLPSSPPQPRSASGSQTRPSSRHSLYNGSKSSRSTPSPPPSPVHELSHRRRVISRLTDPQATLQPLRTPKSPPHSPARTPVALGGRSVLDTIDPEESLLMAQMVPIPNDDDEDSEADESVMLSFSAAFEHREMRPSAKLLTRATSSAASAVSPPSASESLEEDALRVRAEQAESAAQELLQFVEPENGSLAPPAFPLRNPVTPLNKQSSVMRQAMHYKDSPQNVQSSLMDALKEQRNETGWWLKRKTFDQGTPLKGLKEQDGLQELQGYITTLSGPEGDVETLKKIAVICSEHSVRSDPHNGTDFDPSKPPLFAPNLEFSLSWNDHMWKADGNFDRLFAALTRFLNPQKNEKEIEYALIVLWEMLENQYPYFEGRESEVFSLLLHVRYCDELQVLEAANTIRDALVMHLDSIYGLTTLHAALRTFKAEALPSFANQETKSHTYAFGVMALGKFIMRLPVEILEEELPRLKATLITALNDPSSLVVRESAAACMIAAQVVLRDETQLFILLDGLSDEKKNLLTYLFDKHGVRGSARGGAGGLEKLEKEMRRLDVRTNTPPRSRLTHT